MLQSWQSTTLFVGVLALYLNAFWQVFRTHPGNRLVSVWHHCAGSFRRTAGPDKILFRSSMASKLRLVSTPSPVPSYDVFPFSTCISFRSSLAVEVRLTRQAGLASPPNLRHNKSLP